MRFGKIPYWRIINAGLLSKRQMMVFDYICSQRFIDDAPVICPRYAIANDLGLARSHVSAALAELVEMGWLIEAEKSAWQIPEKLPNRSQKLPKRSLSKLPNRSLLLPNQSQKVTESVTPYIRNIDIKNNSISGELSASPSTVEIQSEIPLRNIKKGSRIPETFEVTEQHRQFATKHSLQVDLDREVLKFKNYWESLSGKNAYKLNWDKTFQNWLLNAKPDPNFAKRTEHQEMIAKFGRPVNFV